VNPVGFPAYVKQGQIVMIEVDGKEESFQAIKDFTILDQKHFNLIVKIRHKFGCWAPVTASPAAPTLVAKPSTEVDLPDLLPSGPIVVKGKDAAGVVWTYPTQTWATKDTVGIKQVGTITDPDSEIRQVLIDRVTEVLYDLGNEFGYEVVLKHIKAEMYPDKAATTGILLGFRFQAPNVPF
jgi:hypothetical protein